MKKLIVLLTCFRTGALLVIFLLFSPFTAAAAFLIHPTLSVSEEYIDNIFETRDDKKSDFITRLMPGVALDYKAPLWDWDLSYFFDYRYYAQNNHDNEYNHDLKLHGLTRVIRDLLFWDVSEIYRKVSLNVARDTTRDSLFTNQSDSNEFSTSPYFNFRLGQNTTLKTGYRYVNVWYKDPSAVDRRDHIGFADMVYQYSPKVSLMASYIFTHENSITPYNRHSSYAGFKYDYKDRSFVFGQGGYTWFGSKKHESGALNSPYWNAGITHALSTYTISLTTGVQYPVDPLSGVTKETDYAMVLAKELNRGRVDLSLFYAKYSGGSIDTKSKYGAALTTKHDLGDRLQAYLSGNVEKYNHRFANTYTRRISINPALSYTLPKEIILTLNYMFIDYYSPRVDADNYTVNRVILEAKKKF